MLRSTGAHGRSTKVSLEESGKMQALLIPSSNTASLEAFQLPQGYWDSYRFSRGVRHRLLLKHWTPHSSRLVMVFSGNLWSCLMEVKLLHPWDSPGENTVVGCHFFLQCMKVKMKVKSLSCVLVFETPWTAAHQAPPSMGFFQARVLKWVAIAFSII